MFAEIVVLVGDINFSLAFLEGYFSCCDLALAGDHADTALEPPAVGDILHMEKFIEIFFPVDRDHQVLER